jgi:putative ABC transport system substrate-binding protein
MQRRSMVKAALVGGATLAQSGLAQPALAQSGLTQPRPRPVRIGWLTGQRQASIAPYLAAFREAMAAAGYVEGQNLTIEYRYGDEDLSRVPALARELASLPVAVLMVQGVAAQVAPLGLSVPIAYVMSADPVIAGLATSLAHPTHNMTGLTFMAAELNAKRLEMLRDIVPGLRQVAVIGNPEHAGEELERATARETGQRLGLDVSFNATRSLAELEQALGRIAGSRVQALSVFADGFAVQHRQRLAAFALQHRLPLISGWSVFAESGALCIYGPRLRESYRRLAHYVDRLIRGAQPADLPIERPTVFEFVINQQTAAAIGVSFPPHLLALADTVID